MTHEHKWVEEYYGYKCECGAFIPYGCEPWIPTDEELHEMILSLHWQVPDGDSKEINA